MSFVTNKMYFGVGTGPALSVHRVKMDRARPVPTRIMHNILHYQTISKRLIASCFCRDTTCRVLICRGCGVGTMHRAHATSPLIGEIKAPLYEVGRGWGGVGYFRDADGGSRTHTLSESSLSRSRLPFRHIGMSKFSHKKHANSIMGIIA